MSVNKYWELATKQSACEGGHCNVLHDDSVQCDYRKKGKLSVCDYMNQHTDFGMCMRVKANKLRQQKRGNFNSAFYLRLQAEFEEAKARKARKE